MHTKFLKFEVYESFHFQLNVLGMRHGQEFSIISSEKHDSLKTADTEHIEILNFCKCDLFLTRAWENN